MTACSPSPAAHLARRAAAARAPPDFRVALLLSTLAGASTGLGALLAVARAPLSARALGRCQAAAAGFMTAVSLLDLLPAALADLPPAPAAASFAAGAAAFALLKACVPEPHLSALARPKHAAAHAAAPHALWSGLLTAAGIALHNFPEGIAVCVASLRGLRFGLPLALAIALHNLPEGMVVALPLYFATGRKAYAVRMAFLSGMAEPAGVLFVFAFVHTVGDISRRAVAVANSAVAGVMVLLSVAELAPQALMHAPVADAALAAALGFALMAAGLVAIYAMHLAV